MKCVQCGSEGFEPTTVDDEIQIGESVFRTAMPAERCARCGELYIDNENLQRFDLLVARALGSKGVLTGPALRFMRKALRLRGGELAALLGVRPETVSRWENERIPLDPIAFTLVGSMVNDRLEGSSDTADRLRATRNRDESGRLDLTLDLASA